MRQTLSSYLGHFKHANSFKLSRSLFEKYPYLKDIFSIDDEGSLLPLYEPSFEPENFSEQYKWVTDHYGIYCIFFQVGRYCEFYQRQAELYGRTFGLKLDKSKRMFGLQCGFPVRYLKDFKKRALLSGMPYIVVGERGYYPSGLKKRVVTEICK